MTENQCIFALTKIGLLTKKVSSLYMAKILVTGGSGFVGSRIVKRWSGEYEILTPRHHEMDITDAAAVMQYCRAHKPDVVVHTAAISNTGYCEEHPEESLRVNATAAIGLAEAATEIGAKYIFFSSDQIYNGNREQGLLYEDIDVAPVNHYGRHKLLAEQGIMELLPDAVLLRATWMYDLPAEGLPAHPNFITNSLNAASTGHALRFATHEHRGITDVGEVVEYLPKTFELPGGIYNYGAENELNTYETALRFVKDWQGEDTAKSIVVPDTERFAQQPRNISISTDKVKALSLGEIAFTDTLEGLKRFVQENHLSE